MNQLEQAMLAGVRLAQNDYERMTGWWLSHGPESFLTCSVASTVAKTAGYSVFLEASPNKINKSIATQGKVRKPSTSGQRFDMVVWYKADNSIKAIVEVKRAWSIDDLRGDRYKIAKYIGSNGNVSDGYLLAYTDAKGSRRGAMLSGRLADWADGLNCEMAGAILEDEADEEWGWAAGLFRFSD